MVRISGDAGQCVEVERAVRGYRVAVYGERWDQLRPAVVLAPRRLDVTLFTSGPLPATPEGTCLFPGCTKALRKNTLCPGHDRQLDRAGFMRPLGTLRRWREPKVRHCVSCGFAMRRCRGKPWCPRCTRERVARNYLRRNHPELIESPVGARCEALASERTR